MIRKARYAMEEIFKHWDDSGWWRQRLIARGIGPTLKHLHNQNTVDYMSRDWDNLMILDACRADMFEETFDTSNFDEYERVVSPGASSPEWMSETFGNKEFADTVYITGNPWISKVAPDSFHDIINVWVDNYGVPEDEIQDSITLGDVETTDRPTCHPQDVNKAAEEAFKKYPNKRLIIHYFQPHGPVCGWSDGTPRQEIDDSLHPGGIQEGQSTKKEVWEAYKENLGYAFHYADELDRKIGGKTVFTADHGELFGDKLSPFPVRGYAHPSGVHHPKLLTVPWAVRGGTRRKITAGETADKSVPETEVNERLRDLGYKT